MLKLTVISLGCAKNLVDSERAVAQLLGSGMEFVDDIESADVVYINTCSFIGPARDEAEQTFAEVSSLVSDDARVIVAGCYSQMLGDKLHELFPRADAVVGTGYVNKIGDIVRDLERGAKLSYTNNPGTELSDIKERTLLTAPHFAYLKIADGCDHKCTFCVIPKLRGQYASRPISDIVSEAEQIANLGVQELNLLAQDTTRYGYDLPDNPTLLNLLAELDDVNIPWIRVNYMHPEYLSNELIEFIGSSNRILPYFDIPLQSGSPNVLKSMGRKPNSVEETINQLKGIRDTIADAVIRTTFITGFPGETDDDFKNTLELTQQARFDYLGVFEYSDESMAASSKLIDKIDGSVANERANLLMQTQSVITKELNDARIGKTDTAIIDFVLDGTAMGRIWRQAPEVDPTTNIYQYPDDLEEGDIVTVKITGHYGYELTADFVDYAS